MPLDWQLNTTVLAIQGRAVSATPPADKDVLTWDNASTSWIPAATQVADTVFNYNGTVSDPGSLPSSDQSTGDVWYSQSDSTLYFWNGSAWVPLGLGEAPNDGQTYGRNGSTGTWDPVLLLSGGTMTGPIELAGDAQNALEPVTLQQMDNALNDLQNTLESQITSAAQFLGTLDAPVGQVFYTPQSGLASGPLVPASQVPGAFVICINAGTIPAGGPAAGTALLVGDWLVSDGVAWVPINVMGTGSGNNITSVVSGTGITVNTVNGVATVSLFTPVSIANGGTSATSAGGALDALSGSAGTATGLLQRASNGVWSLVPGGGGGGPTDATQVTTNPTISGWTTVQQALQGLFNNQAGFAPIASPVFTGDPQAPNPPPGDNDQSIATTSWVNATIAAYVAQWATENGVLTDVTTSGDVTSV